MSPQERKQKKEIRQRMRKGIYVLPNLVTATSLLFAFYSIVSTINGDYGKAAWAILLSLVFDALDGRVARATRTTSAFGVQFDSLCDLVAFGVAPALLAYSWALKPYQAMGWFAAFFFILCGALRLARFNIHSGSVRSDRFEGMPVPGAAAVIASGTIAYYWFEKDISQGPALMDWVFRKMEIINHQVDTYSISVLLTFYILGFLMISNLPYPSFKNREKYQRHPLWLFAVVVLMINALIVNVHVTLFLVFALYALSGPVVGLLELLGGLLPLQKTGAPATATTGNKQTEEDQDRDAETTATTLPH